MGFVDEEFLHKKVNKIDIYIWGLWYAAEDIQEDSYMYQGTGSVSQALRRFDSTELKEVTKVLQLCFS